tara:strand:- start:165 stop:560 length:396 start_codon:yes stop_codon:yes gene_type:complete
MIKVNYNTETTLVKGYYPNSINYASIPEPYIEIENDAQVLDKQMCVVNGVYQEYVKPLDVQLQKAKVSKIAQCKAYLISTDWQVIRLSDPTSGDPLKEGVAEKRVLARSLQVNIEACTTLEELNNINIDFS